MIDDTSTLMRSSVWSFHGLDDDNPVVLRGRQVEDWLEGTNVNADGTLVDHDRFGLDVMVDAFVLDHWPRGTKSNGERPRPRPRRVRADVLVRCPGSFRAGVRARDSGVNLR